MEALPITAQRTTEAERFSADCFGSTLHYTPHHLITRSSDRRTAPGAGLITYDTHLVHTYGVN